MFEHLHHLLSPLFALDYSYTCNAHYLLFFTHFLLFLYLLFTHYLLIYLLIYYTTFPLFVVISRVY